MDKKPYYLKGAILRSNVNFPMTSGAIAFKKGKFYEVKDVLEYSQYPYFDYIFDSEIAEGHVMPEEDVKKYFSLVG